MFKESKIPSGSSVSIKRLEKNKTTANKDVAQQSSSTAKPKTSNQVKSSNTKDLIVDIKSSTKSASTKSLQKLLKKTKQKKIAL